MSRHLILNDLQATGQSYRPVVLSYMIGLALFHLGNTERAFEVFRIVESESDLIRGQRRILRWYLASTPSGQAMKFHGTVTSLSADARRGQVYVDEIRRNVPFFPSDFGRPDIRTRQSLGEFHIAFNFLGPSADPVSHVRK